MNIDVIFGDGLVNYQDAMITMDNKVNAIVAGQELSAVWFLQHDHIYTTGASGTDNNPNIVPTGRGGKATYHGPGQRVVYLMLDLRNGRLDLKLYLRDLELWIIRALARSQVSAHYVDGNTGVWIAGKKVASIGIRARKWVVFHGVAINVNPDMTRFAAISPCGMNPEVMTSLENIVTMQELDKNLLAELPLLLESLRI